MQRHNIFPCASMGSLGVLQGYSGFTVQQHACKTTVCKVAPEQTTRLLEDTCQHSGGRMMIWVGFIAPGPWHLALIIKKSVSNSLESMEAHPSHMTYLRWCSSKTHPRQLSVFRCVESADFKNRYIVWIVWTGQVKPELHCTDDLRLGWSYSAMETHLMELSTHWRPHEVWSCSDWLCRKLDTSAHSTSTCDFMWSTTLCISCCHSQSLPLCYNTTNRWLWND